MKITIHCGHCNGSFDFEHPSVTHAADLRGMTFTCSWCGVKLQMPSNEVHMEAIIILPKNVTMISRKVV